MISNHHKVIFVHIPKCAGQSIEMAFLKDVGLTWDTRSPMLLRPKLNNEFGPQRLAHLFAYEYVKYGYISKFEYNQFYKFSVVRDPIDRIISELNYRKVKKGFSGVRSILDYVQKINKNYPLDSDLVRHILPQIDFVLNEDKDEIIVDKIIRFEELNTGFQKIRISIDCANLELVHINSSITKHWSRSELSMSDFEFLSEYYADDFNLIAKL